MNELVGLVSLYAWIHGIVIVFNKLKDLTKYEKVVIWVAFVTIVLFIIGMFADL